MRGPMFCMNVHLLLRVKYLINIIILGTDSSDIWLDTGDKLYIKWRVNSIDVIDVCPDPNPLMAPCWTPVCRKLCSVTGWVCEEEEGLSSVSSARPPAVCPGFGGEVRGRFQWAVASVKIEGGERSTWRPTSGTKAGSRLKQVSVASVFHLHACIYWECNDSFMFLSPWASLCILAPAPPPHPHPSCNGQ